MRQVIREVYEDNHLLAIDKPAGWLVQGDRTGDANLFELTKQHLKEKYQKPGDAYLGLCHRLDRPVSGLLLFAKTSKALPRINRLFQSQQMAKCYLAITRQRPAREFGLVRHYLVKDRSRNTVRIGAKADKEAKEAITKYQVVAAIDGLHLWRLTPETGRSHQLRVALASLGCPILGDLKYGGSPLDRHRIGLHCYSMSFEHPVKRQPIELSAPMPDAWPWSLFRDFPLPAYAGKLPDS